MQRGGAGMASAIWESCFIPGARALIELGMKCRFILCSRQGISKLPALNLVCVMAL